ncbi:hypothetical protein [Paracoccus sp. (in: a-proteobacteria)]|uniref:hypothetical protein n=1 Tax=Paracoccus sp. TaxID=267 RepID=UPI0040583859
MGGYLPLANINRMWRGSDELGWLGHDGASIWQKQATLQPISDFYGVGMGQVPTDYNPALASYNGSNLLTSMPNQGGAGSYFNAIPEGTPTLNRVADSDLLNYSGNNWLTPANALNLLGTRSFFVVNLTFPERLVYIVGNVQRLYNPSSNDGLTNIRFDSLLGNVRFQRHNGSTWVAVDGNSWWPTIGSGFYLLELEIIANGQVKFFVDGVQLGQMATPAQWPDFPISRIGHGQGNPGISGSMGRIVSLITDGSSAYDPAIASIRQELKNQYPGLN